MYLNNGSAFYWSSLKALGAELKLTKLPFNSYIQFYTTRATTHELLWNPRTIPIETRPEICESSRTIYFWSAVNALWKYHWGYFFHEDVNFSSLFSVKIILFGINVCNWYVTNLANENPFLQGIDRVQLNFQNSKNVALNWLKAENATPSLFTHCLLDVSIS